MNLPEDLLKMLKQANELNKLSLSSSPLFQMLQEQKKLEVYFPVIKMEEGLLNSIRQFQSLNIENNSLLELSTFISKIKPNFNIPISSIDAIKSLMRHHENLFGSFKNISNDIKQNFPFSQINNFQNALAGFSDQLTTLAIKQKKWDLIEDFDKITTDLASINGRISEDEGVTRESLNEIKSLLYRIDLKAEKIDNDASALIWKVFIILSLFLSIISEIHNLIPKPNYASREEVETIIKDQFSKFESYLKTNNQCWTTNRICKVMLKPKNNTIVKANLPVGFDVIVLETKHKWIFISFTNPKDNLPQTGWVLKKYLSH